VKDEGKDKALSRVRNRIFLELGRLTKRGWRQHGDSFAESNALELENTEQCLADRSSPLRLKLPGPRSYPRGSIRSVRIVIRHLEQVPGASRPDQNGSRFLTLHEMAIGLCQRRDGGFRPQGPYLQQNTLLQLCSPAPSFHLHGHTNSMTSIELSQLIYNHNVLPRPRLRAPPPL
jgi:hypothetical protein